MKTALSVLGLLGAFALLTVATNLPRVLRQRKLAASRAGVDAFAVFRESLPDIPEEVLRRLYVRVQGLLPGRDFPLRGDDNLVKTLEIDQGNLADIVEDLIPASSLPASPGIETLADLAKAVWSHEKR
jgi:hypothetical protein